MYKILQETPGELFILGDARSTLSFDGEKNSLSLKQTFLWRTTTTTIDFGEVEQLRLEGFVKEKGYELMLHVNDKASSYMLPMKIKDLNRHEEAVELLFRIAAIMGAQGYFVRKKTERYIDLELLEEAPSELTEDPFRALAYGEHALREGVRAEISEPKEIAHFKEEHGVFQEPPEEVAPFDPGELKDKKLGKITEFSLGERVSLEAAIYEKKRADKDKIFTARVLGLVFFLLGLGLISLGAWMLLIREQLTEGLIMLIPSVIALLAPIFSYVEIERAAQEAMQSAERFAGSCELLFSWEARALSQQRSGEPTRQISFDDMECLALFSVRQTSSAYTYRVVLLLPGEDISLLYTMNNSKPQPDKDDPCVRFMIDLARSLSLPWRIA